MKIIDWIALPRPAARNHTTQRVPYPAAMQFGDLLPAALARQGPDGPAARIEGNRLHPVQHEPVHLRRT